MFMGPGCFRSFEFLPQLLQAEQKAEVPAEPRANDAEEDHHDREAAIGRRRSAFSLRRE